MAGEYYVLDTRMDQTAEAAPPKTNWLRTALIGRRPDRTLIRVALLVVVSVVVFRFILLPVRVQGASMAPTYRGGVNFVNRLAYVLGEPKRGDVVAIATSGHSIMYLKRIIGMPGETIAFHDGKAFINGRMLREPYVKSTCDWERPEVTLGADEYYFAGDNRGMPRSDHAEGQAHRERIVGKVLL